MTTAEKPGRVSSGRTADRRWPKESTAQAGFNAHARKGRGSHEGNDERRARPGTERPASGRVRGYPRVMSLERYRKARELIANAGQGDFEGPKPESLVARAEAALGLTFPPSYRQFLLDLGCGDVAGFEVLRRGGRGLRRLRGPGRHLAHAGGARATVSTRASSSSAPWGTGRYDCLDTAHLDASGEAPVVQLSADFEDPVKLADSFGEYLPGRGRERAFRRGLTRRAAPRAAATGARRACSPSAGAPGPAPSGCRAGR